MRRGEVTGELLEIVEAEERADTLLEQANARSETLRRAAIAKREERLANVQPVTPKEIKAPAVRTNTAALRKAAKKNERKAIARILEAFHAQA